MKRKLKETEENVGTKETEETSENEAKSKKVKNDEPDDEDGSEELELDLNFDIKRFRQNLKVGNFYDDLKLFIKKAAKSQEIIRAFTDSGGKPLEIVEIIKNNEDSSLEVISSLYHMLRMLIFYIVNDEGQRLDPTIQALKFLVNRNKISVEKMLASSKTSDKVLMLKILSIGISLNAEIGHDILKNIEIFSKSTEKDDFSNLEDKQKKKAPYDDSVRLAFAHFMLGFLLNEKDLVLRKKILQKRSLFEFFLRDLHQDNFETVKGILTCLTKNVLISTAFSKPEKLKIFTDNAIKSILKLYEWKEEESEKSSVVNITHQFLLLLLTSKKHGIVFKALSEKRQNLRQLQVINLFKNVWNFEYPSLLLIEIIKSCPDLMQNLLNRLAMGLQPRITTNWFMCANFANSLLTSLDPSVMIQTFSTLEPKKISSNIIKLSISQFILQNLNERALILQESLEIREMSAQLLHVMLDRCCLYLDEVIKITTLKDFEKHRIKFDLINHIFTFYPNIDIILNSLYRSISSNTEKKSDDKEKLVKSQLKHTLEILLLVIKNFPSIIEKIPSVIDYLEVLRPIYEYQLTGSDDVDKNEDLEIEMKVVKIILYLQPSILSLESEIFKRVFLVLIQVYCCSLTEDYRNDAKMLLTGILHNTSIFNADDSLEIDIWLEVFRSIKRGILKESATTFVKVLRTIKSSEKDSLKWSTTNEVECDQDLLAMIDGTDLEEILKDDQFVLSPVLPALLSMKSDKINRIIDLAEVSLVLIYHSYPHQKKQILDLLANDRVELNTNISSYIKKKNLVDFGDTLQVFTDLVFRKFQRALIEEETIELETTDIQQLQLLIVQAVFSATQLDKNGKLSDDKVELLSWYIREFYKKILKAEKEDKFFASTDVFQKLQPEGEDKKVNKICDLSLSQPSKMIVNYIFKQQTLVLEKFNIASPNQMTSFIAKLSDIFKESDDFEKCTNGFRDKIISDIKEALSGEGVQENVADIIEKFPLDAENCISILNALVKSKSIVESHVKLLKQIIERLTTLKTTPLSSKQMQKVEKIYINAFEDGTIELVEFETVLLEYLMTFSHNIGDLSNKMFKLAFKDDQTVTRSFARLVSSIFSRNDSWNDMFKSDVMKLKKELMFPLLGIALEKGIVANEQMKPIYQEFKSGMIKTVEKPNKAAQIYRENIQTSMKVIEFLMPLNECQDLAMKKFKFDASEIYQLKMLHAIFTKALKANPEGKIFTNFVNHWFNLFAISIAKSSNVNEAYLEVLCEWLKAKPTALEVTEIEVNEKIWETFYKTCLKSGLKSADGSKMLVLLGQVIRTISMNPEDVVTIFDMILTHSNFFNVVFNFRSSGRVIKRNLFFLLNVLVQKNPAVAHEKHVPIFLSAYQASMSACDQLILNLLRFYELKCEVDFFDFRPFLFGSTALSHFTSSDDQEMKLIKKNVDDMNIVIFKLLNSFEKSMVENTVNNYPIRRQLAGVPASDLDQFLEDLPETENVYDPGYFLPLFEMVLDSSTFNFTSAAVKNNLMSLIFPALSCEDENMRLLSAHCLLKCRESNDGKKSKNDVWIRFYDSLQYGLGDIREGTISKDKSDKHFPRAASISTQLLSEIVNILPNTLHNVYNVVANYLAVRQKFDFTTIPELLVLFHSSDVKQEEHRLFLLNAIFNGIKDDLDFKLLNNSPLLKMIFSCYGCPLSDRKIDLTILKIIDRVVTKTSKIQFLIQRYGLALWIFQAAAKVEAFEYETIEMLLTLIEHSFIAIRKDIKEGDDSSCKRLLASLLVLLPKFTKTKLAPNCFASFLKTINAIDQFSHINKENNDAILELLKIFLSENLLRKVTYLDEHPGASKFAETKEKFSKSLAPDIDIITKSILVEGREFLMSFHQKK